MLCTNCGARMIDTDQFCPKCGAKAIKDMRCPDCGEVLREGTVFCHKCGRQIGSKSDTGKVQEETLDIPIDAIERNILSETAAEIRADHSPASRSTSSTRTTAAHASAQGSVSHERKTPVAPPSSRRSSATAPSTKKTPAAVPSSRKSPAAAPTSRKSAAAASTSRKKAVYREEEEWENDWDEEEEGVDIITIMTAVVGCVLLVVVAILGYHLYQQYGPGNYEREEELSEDEENTFFDQELGEEQGQEQEQEQTSGAEVSDRVVTVIENVRVRDYPSTSDSNVLKVAKEGEVYPYQGSTEDEQWYEILLEDGSVGYVFHEYVTVD